MEKNDNVRIPVGGGSFLTRGTTVNEARELFEREIERKARKRLRELGPLFEKWLDKNYYKKLKDYEINPRGKKPDNQKSLQLDLF